MPTRGEVAVVGSGPNGLAAAIECARAGFKVRVYEAQDTLGGGARSAAVTLPGFTHDLCSAIHPLAVATRYLPSLPLERYGLEWIHPPLPLAHPFDDGTAAVLDRSLESTAAQLGCDAGAYRTLMGPVVAAWPEIEAQALAPLRLPRHPISLARFGARALPSASGIARRRFRTREARALFAGLAAHTAQPLEQSASAAIAIILAAAAHRAGWPMPRGGAQAISNAMAAYLESLGGEIVTSRKIETLDELAPAAIVFCDVSPSGLLRLCGDRLPPAYRRRLERFQPGPGVFKTDWALKAPIPWTAPECARAGTVHLGGTWEEVNNSERAACARRPARPPERPFVLLSQPSLFDPTRAPANRHVAWAYCHVPNSFNGDMSAAIEAQIERFAPGFSSVVLHRRIWTPAVMQQHNANLEGGDITGGANTLGQLLRRPTWSAYRTPLRGVYLCSASTPPGGGVHGLCGFYAALAALASKI